MKNKLLLFVLLLCAFVFAASSDSVKSRPRTAEIGRCSENGPDWSRATVVCNNDFTIVGGAPFRKPTQQTKVLACWNEKAFYLKFHCREENMAGRVLHHTGNASWQNDCVEIFMAPMLNRDKMTHVAVSGDGVCYVFLSQDADAVQVIDYDAGDNFWSVTISFAWSFIGGRVPFMGLAVSRERYAGNRELTSWNWPYGFGNHVSFGVAFLEPAAKVFSELSETVRDDTEYLACLKSASPEGEADFRKWLAEGKKLRYKADSQAVVEWMFAWRRLADRFPRNDTIYIKRIDELLKRP